MAKATKRAAVTKLRLLLPDPSRITITRHANGKYFVRMGRYHEGFATYEAARAEAQRLFDTEDEARQVVIIDRVVPPLETQ